FRVQMCRRSGTRYPVHCLLVGILIVLRPPRFPTFAQRVVQIRFADVAEFPFNRSFFLTMTAVDEICAAAPHNSKLPFRKRITAAQPALLLDRFPATIKTFTR